MAAHRRGTGGSPRAIASGRADRRPCPRPTWKPQHRRGSTSFESIRWQRRRPQETQQELHALWSMECPYEIWSAPIVLLTCVSTAKEYFQALYAASDKHGTNLLSSSTYFVWKDKVLRSLERKTNCEPELKDSNFLTKYSTNKRYSSTRRLFQHVDSRQKMSATGLVVFDRTCTVPSSGFADKSAKCCLISPFIDLPMLCRLYIFSTLFGIQLVASCCYLPYTGHTWLSVLACTGIAVSANLLNILTAVEKEEISSRFHHLLICHDEQICNNDILCAPQFLVLVGPTAHGNCSPTLHACYLSDCFSFS